MFCLPAYYNYSDIYSYGYKLNNKSILAQTFFFLVQDKKDLAHYNIHMVVKRLPKQIPLLLPLGFPEESALCHFFF